VYRPYGTSSGHALAHGRRGNGIATSPVRGSRRGGKAAGVIRRRFNMVGSGTRYVFLKPEYMLYERIGASGSALDAQSRRIEGENGAQQAMVFSALPGDGFEMTVSPALQ
jgi:hypothetical protein